MNNANDGTLQPVENYGHPHPSNTEQLREPTIDWLIDQLTSASPLAQFNANRLRELIATHTAEAVRASNQQHDDLFSTFQEAMKRAGIDLQLQSTVLQHVQTVTREVAKAQLKDKQSSNEQ